MPEKLEPTDFRAGRWKMLPDDFAISSDEPEPPPRDLITEEAWQSIVVLPDDVSIRTSSHLGTDLSVAHELWGEWIGFTLDIFGLDAQKSPLDVSITNSMSELQASLYNAMTGFYRTGISALRNALEHVTIGLDFELNTDSMRLQNWLNGDDDVATFGRAASSLSNTRIVQDLEGQLLRCVSDNLFRQKDKTKSDPGGMTRRLFSELSKYTHGSPGKTEADLWESNGPIFSLRAFMTWRMLFGKTMAVALILVRIGRPSVEPIEKWKELFGAAIRLVPEGNMDKVLDALSEDVTWV